MTDIDKNRAEYVVSLEEKLQHAQQQLAHYKPIAEKWLPILSGDSTNGDARFTLSFGGKRVTAVVNSGVLKTTDTTTMVSSVIDTLIESLVADRLREVVAPEVERLARAARAAEKNTW